MEKGKFLQMGGRKFFLGEKINREGKGGKYLEREKIFFLKAKKTEKDLSALIEFIISDRA